MAVAWVKSAQNVLPTGGASISVNFTATNTGDVIIVMGGEDVVSHTMTIAATGAGWSSLTWNTLVARTTTTGTNCTSWWAIIPNTTATTITITHSAPSSFSEILVDEFTGNHATTPIAGTNVGTGSGTPSITVTPTADNCQLWGGSVDTNTAVGGGFTKGADDTSGDWSEHLTTTLSGGSGVAQTVNFSGSGTWLMMGAAIQPPTVTVPTLSSISPRSGTVDGSTAIDLTGTGFIAGATVSFGGTLGTSVSVNSTTDITCNSPAGLIGTVDVVVTTSGGSATLSSSYTYWSLATQSTRNIGIWSKDAVLAVGVFDIGIPTNFGLYDDDFVAQFSGTAAPVFQDGMIGSVPWGVFDRKATLLGLYGAI